MDNKMDPQVKTEWVAALRSGEYRQGKGYLRDLDTYCCLGVLCDLYAEKGEGEWIGSIFQFGESDDDFANEGSGILPKTLAKHVGLVDENPVPHGELSLAELNDGAGGRLRLTFGEIADIIEENL